MTSFKGKRFCVEKMMLVRNEGIEIEVKKVKEVYEVISQDGVQVLGWNGKVFEAFHINTITFIE